MFLHGTLRSVFANGSLVSFADLLSAFFCSTAVQIHAKLIMALKKNLLELSLSVQVGKGGNALRLRSIALVPACWGNWELPLNAAKCLPSIGIAALGSNVLLAPPSVSDELKALPDGWRHETKEWCMQSCFFVFFFENKMHFSHLLWSSIFPQAFFDVWLLLAYWMFRIID